jgi:hypothetical protein
MQTLRTLLLFIHLGLLLTLFRSLRFTHRFVLCSHRLGSVTLWTTHVGRWHFCSSLACKCLSKYTIRSRNIRSLQSGNNGVVFETEPNNSAGITSELVRADSRPNAAAAAAAASTTVCQVCHTPKEIRAGSDITTDFKLRYSDGRTLLLLACASSMHSIGNDGAFFIQPSIKPRLAPRRTARLDSSRPFDGQFYSMPVHFENAYTTGGFSSRALISAESSRFN